MEKGLNDALKIALKKDWHRTKSEFVRDAVREKLTALGIEPQTTETQMVDEG